MATLKKHGVEFARFRSVRDSSYVEDGKRIEIQWEEVISIRSDAYILQKTRMTHPAGRWTGWAIGCNPNTDPSHRWGHDILCMAERFDIDPLWERVITEESTHFQWYLNHQDDAEVEYGFYSRFWA